MQVAGWLQNPSWYFGVSSKVAYRPLTGTKSRLDFDLSQTPNSLLISSGEPGGTRTRDPMIKSHVLYRLSYGLLQKDPAFRQCWRRSMRVGACVGGGLDAVNS